METLRLSKAANWFLILTILVICLIYFRNLIEPFVLSLFIWYLIRAARNGIGRIKIKGKSFPKWVQVTLSFLLTFGVLWGLYEIISYNVFLIIEKFPEYGDNLNGIFSGIKNLPYIDQLPVIDDVDKFVIDNLGSLDIQSYISGIILTRTC